MGTAGTISLDEFGAVLGTMGVDLGADNLAHVYHRFDRDKSGALEYDEFIAALDSKTYTNPLGTEGKTQVPTQAEKLAALRAHAQRLNIVLPTSGIATNVRAAGAVVPVLDSVCRCGLLLTGCCSCAGCGYCVPAVGVDTGHVEAALPREALTARRVQNLGH